MADSRRLSLLELERGGVHAIAEAGGLGAVVEDVAQVAATAGAEDFGAGDAGRVIGTLDDAAGLDGRPEAGPAGARFEFRRGTKQRVPAGRTDINSLLVIIQQSAGEGRFRAGVAQDVVSGRGEKGAPFGVRFRDLIAYLWVRR